ncbi:thioredoxin-related transmembrane protein 2-B-like [Mizuhopecten yessoensis]|uniref:Thioredoxin-related transmembrane protein 2-B n=1 Tax=Mizuhopecten yessoensis TaxID=6573 RepID=A0A210Q3M3_MIZYE|nr:thioredoxin-related transmembrane protein 2-B-like [Mizuhopecten yessoensis]OWF43330.1 Thioredoxin-related transmembrane protein 2-B [Mizuhopecten yessoensis]
MAPTTADMIAGLKTCLVPHCIGNIVLALSYLVMKTFPPICSRLFEDCSLELKEWEWITFLGCIIVVKNRKQATIGAYINTTCLFAKVLCGFMFFRANSLYGILFGVACLFHFVFMPERMYTGPEMITYFRGPNLDEEIKRDRRVTWLVTFYVAWSPPCVSFANIFSELSAEYSLENLKFGKIDIAKYPEVAEKYRISASPMSRQLPTIVMLEGGEETMRKPYISPKGTVVRYIFNKENIIKDFELNIAYDKCKKNPLKPRKSEKEKAE